MKGSGSVRAAWRWRARQAALMASSMVQRGGWGAAAWWQQRLAWH